ncbi:hypothetical protein Taro_023628 [Colocasia esculenta]|uniref:Uncharacterized protein n=1 Tax=Colocasia esculenta TaxID=4460 RepID=A0A843V701_COLES|nr:hypothetical protein [Colocasia esculenta]
MRKRSHWMTRSRRRRLGTKSFFKFFALQTLGIKAFKGRQSLKQQQINFDPKQTMIWATKVKSRVGPEMKQDLLLFSWSWRPGMAVDWLASRLVDVDCMNLAAVDVDAKGSEEWLDGRRMRGVAELREETPYRGAIPVGARRGLSVNREITGGSSTFRGRGRTLVAP